MRSPSNREAAQTTTALPATSTATSGEWNRSEGSCRVVLTLPSGRPRRSKRRTKMECGFPQTTVKSPSGVIATRGWEIGWLSRPTMKLSPRGFPAGS